MSEDKYFYISVEYFSFGLKKYLWEHLQTYCVYHNGLKIEFSNQTIFIKKHMISQENYGMLWKQLLLREIPRTKNKGGKKYEK